ncbi:MAG: peptide chain release factor N(5)-glutamine methyltransferase [Bacteroidales bacterium]|nr:peptide chain release factor N(5)-glutamine methyltransferase [Bacteroidales bacterium]
MQAQSILNNYKQNVNSLKSIYPLAEAQAMVRLLIEKVTGIKAHDALANPYLLLSISQESLIDAYIEELKLQKPIQYILGETEFFGINLKVNPHVLIPRPETEELVEWLLADRNSDFPSVLDIGTGSGCIAIAIAKRLPAAKVFALDISAEAIILAKGNSMNASTRITFFQQDILNIPSELKGAPYDIVVSNPPYVRNSEKEIMHPNVLDNEPENALFVSDDDPLVFYRAIAQTAQTILKPNGMVYCEINEALGQETAKVFKDNGFTDIEVRKDINGKDRMLRASKQ